MKQKIEDHQKIQTYANTIKEIADTAIRDKKTPAQLKREIEWLCLLCFKTPDEIKDCDTCNGFTRTKEEIGNNLWSEYVFFEG